MEELVKKFREVNRSLVTKGLGVKLWCKTYIRNRELLKGIKYAWNMMEFEFLGRLLL